MRTGALPTVSVIAQRILSLDLDTDDGELEFLRLVETDPLIAARLIGLSNSPLYSPGKKICSVREAIMRLGLAKVRTIALGFALLEPLTVRSCSAFSIRKFWFHSFSTAIGMRVLGTKLPGEARVSGELLFLAGLLHDIGYLAMAYLVPDEFNAFLSKLEANAEVFSLTLEVETFGIAHPELGALLGKTWHLPEEILVVIAGHHESLAPERHASLVFLARLVEGVLEGEERAGDATLPDPAAAAATALGLGRDDVEGMLAELGKQREHIESIAEMLGS